MGFLGFGNYSKPGKGIKKDGDQKKRFFEFFDLFSRKISKLIQLNLMFVLFCIPAIIIGVGGVYIAGIAIVSEPVFMLVASVIIAIAIATTGPAMAGLMKICRYYSEERPVFLWSDYRKAVKDNFKQGLMMSILNALLILVVYHSLTFYYAKILTASSFYLIPFAIILALTLVFVFTSFYTFLVIVSVNLPFKQVLKNSVSFAFLGLKTNIITLFFTGIIFVACLMFVPITLPIFALFTFSFMGLIISFNSFQYVYRYSIRPYYIMNNLKNPYEPEDEEDETIFEDAT